MSRRSLALGGLSALVATSFTGNPAPAFASVDCGDAPSGGTVSSHGSGCELTFNDAGDFSWAIPTGAHNIYALLVGGGGGAYVNDEYSSYGYAGGGGEVTYVDLTTVTSGTSVSITVGEGGASLPTTATEGDDTVLSIGGTDYTAAGGGAGDFSSWLYGFCDPGFDGYWGEGIGAGTPGDEPFGAACIGGQPGIQPSTDPSAPDAFDDVTFEYGHGGGVVANDSEATYTWGSGGSMTVGSTISYNDGLHGFVNIRYDMTPGSSSQSTDSLAATGTTLPFGGLLMGSLAGIVIGVVATVARRSRRAR